jgi:hypothetical protein
LFAIVTSHLAFQCLIMLKITDEIRALTERTRSKLNPELRRMDTIEEQLGDYEG